jgi:hypothetical protein
MNTSRGDGEPLDDLQTVLSEVEQAPKVQRIERRVELRGQMTVVICLIGMLLVAGWSGWNSVKIAENTANSAIVEEDIKSLREANRLREEAGLPEIPLPAPGEPIDAKAVAAAAAALALEDIKNDPRFRGPQGPRGDSCDSRQVGCQGPAGKDGQPGSQGQDGAPGVDGKDGEPGSPGEDGTTPPCLFTDSQCVGPAGANGISVLSVEASFTEDGDCRFVFTFSDGTQNEVPTSPIVCNVDARN